jgi:glutamate dehydrogenase
MGILGLQERVRSKLFLRRDRYGRFFSALAYIPRDRFNTEVRLRIEAMLKDALRRRAGRHQRAARRVAAGAAAHHRASRAGEQVDVDTAALEAKLASIVRNWQDELRELLVKRHGEEPACAGRAATAAPCRRATSRKSVAGIAATTSNTWPRWPGRTTCA